MRMLVYNVYFQSPQPSGDQHSHRERHDPQRRSASSYRPGPPGHLGVYPAGDRGANQTRLRVLGPLSRVS